MTRRTRPLLAPVAVIVLAGCLLVGHIVLDALYNRLSIHAHWYSALEPDYVIILACSFVLFSCVVLVAYFTLWIRMKEKEQNKALQETSDSALSAESEAHEG